MTSKTIRKNEVNQIVNQLIAGRRKGSTHTSAKHLNEVELKEAIRMALPHRIKIENLPIIGICLTFA